MNYIRDVAGHDRHLRVLRQMTVERRLQAALELSELTRHLFAEGLRRRYPHVPERELRQLARQRLELCHSRRS